MAGKLEIHKIGGEVIDEFLKNVPKSNFVLVHGAGKEITKRLKQNNITVKYKKGQRFTDKKVIEVVINVMNEVRTYILENLSDKTIGVRGDEFFFKAKRIKGLGLVGEVIDFPYKLIEKIVLSGFNLVITPLARDRKDKTVLNINADVFAASLCKKLKVSKIKFWVGTYGVLDENGRIIKKLDKREIDSLIKKKVINNGMYVKIKESLKCKSFGVKEVYIGKTEIL